MKQFSYFILLFVLLLFVSDRVLTRICDYLYTQTKTGQTGGKINYYLSKPTPEIVIMGNSRAFYQIIPDSFRRPTFSLGHAGQTQIFQTGLLKLMEVNSKLPPLLLLHIEPDEFLGDTPYRDIQNLKYYHGKEPFITSYLNELSRFEFLKFSFGLYRFNGRAITLVKNFIQTKTVFKENNGYELVASTPRDSINTIYSANKIVENNDFKFNYEQLNYLKEFISICEKNRVQLICFTSPMFKVTNQSRKASAVLDSLLTANHVRYINLTDGRIKELQTHPAYWRDAHHLNHLGAQIESKILAMETFRILEEE